MEELEFARMLATGSRIPKASGTSASQTHTLIGRVYSVSEDGLVAYVDLHGYTVEGDEEGQAVPFDNYATNISEGDDVIVQLVGEDGAGKTGYVVAAAGRGQQLTYRVDEIDEAARRATASAETAAQKAEEATASAETASEKAGQAISDAASAKASADAAQADAKKANDAASKAQSSADSAATAASDAQASADTADANATKAIADAASASDAAAKAQTSADDAAKDASAASTSAVDAGKAAATAQAAADAAQADVDETQKWFYHDTLGAHVLSSDGDNYRADVTPTALDVVDTGTGHTVASFGKDGVRFDAGYDQTIGSDNAYVRFHADADELEIRAKSVVIGSTDVTDAITDARATADKAQTTADAVDSRLDAVESDYVTDATLATTADGIRGEVARKVSVGSGGTVTDLSSVMEQSADGVLLKFSKTVGGATYQPAIELTTDTDYDDGRTVNSAIKMWESMSARAGGGDPVTEINGSTMRINKVVLVESLRVGGWVLKAVSDSSDGSELIEIRSV